MSAWRFKHLGLAALLLACGLGQAQAQLRLVTLTPHATEMVFAAGAGAQIVATVQSSNFPEAAQAIPRIGDGQNTGIEQVLSWQPDLVLGWPSHLLRQLQQHGVPTHTHTPVSIPELIQEIEALGEQFGTTEYARQTASELRQQLEALNTAPTSATAHARVIVMASPTDDYVIGNDGLINDAIERCGGINPFKSSPLLAPKVNLESMISSKPDLIVTGHPPSDRLQQIAPVHIIDADLLYRPGPRFLEASALLCEAIGQH